MSIVYCLISPLLMIAGFIPITIMVWLWRNEERRDLRHSPLSKSMLRPPGYAISQKLEAVIEDLVGLMLLCVAIPPMIFAMYVSQSYFGAEPDSISRIAVWLTIGLGSMIVICWHINRLVKDRKKFKLGLEGERFTGEELNLLMLEGCRVFHDIQFDYGNIDHVVVSSSGVYAVNSKVLCKPKDGEGKADAIVDHCNNLVRFPDRNYAIPLAQFETERNWLGKHLTSSVGCPINVESILALPGWYIKERIGRGPVYVINPVAAKKFFVRSQQVLSPQDIQQVAHQLEQLCRNLVPSYQENKAW